MHYTVANGSSKTIVTAELENPDNTYDIKVVPADPLTGSITISTSTNIPTVNKVLITATDGSREAMATIDIALWSGFSGKTITVGKPGTLAQLLTKLDKTTLTDLIVVGNLNSADIATLKSLPKLAILDMENVNLETLPSSAFRDKTSLTSVKLPKTLKTIEAYAFCCCNNLISVTIPDGMILIGNSAFDVCRNLASITIPDSVISIGNNAFDCCDNLTSVTMGNSVTSIGNCAFDYCPNLTSITIPDSVTEIGNSVFNMCGSLTAIYCKATIPPSSGSNIVYTYHRDKVTLYVPVGTTEAYKDADGWKEFKNIVEMEF